MTSVSQAGKYGIIESIAIWCAVAVSVSNLGVLIWKGGVLSQVVTSTVQRVDKLEAVGSSQLRTHVDVGAERDKAIEARIAKLEQAILTIPDMREDLAVIRRDLDYLTDRRSGARNSTTP